MRFIKSFTATVLAVSVLGGPFLSLAADDKPQAKLKPYTLTTCVVSGDKLGEMGEPFVYKYKDREIKFCCKSCLKDFNKEPEKYIKKIEKAEKKQAKSEKP